MGGNPIMLDFTLPAQMISFLLLVWVLSKFAWKPLMKVMEDRRNHIEASLAQAEEERRQAEKIRQEYQADMLKARQDAQEVIARATKISEERAEEILSQARAEAEKIKQAAMLDIQREKDRAIAEVRGQVAVLSVAVAERIIRQKLDVSGHEQLIEQYIQEVGDLPC